MLVELAEANRGLTSAMRLLRGLCDEYDDVARGLLENWIDERTADQFLSRRRRDV